MGVPQLFHHQASVQIMHISMGSTALGKQFSTVLLPRSDSGVAKDFGVRAIRSQGAACHSDNAVDGDQGPLCVVPAT